MQVDLALEKLVFVVSFFILRRQTVVDQCLDILGELIDVSSHIAKLIVPQNGVVAGKITACD